MTATFAQRLDFLMRLTNTQNSTLARILNFDASYISRIRSGRRGMPRHQPFVDPAAHYFAGRLDEPYHEPYQRKAAADMICPGRTWPEDQSAAADLIVAWLRGNGEPDDPVGQFLADFEELARQSRELMSSSDVVAKGLTTAAHEDVTYYFGAAGKRRAVEALLGELVEREGSSQLSLFSDEHLAWLYDDPEFERRWTTLLGRIVAQGGRMRVIHAIDHDLPQMLDALRAWLPLYLTGSIEPWWYPRDHDGFFRQTLFVARGHGALIASSLGTNTEGMLNVMVRDVQATAALEREYETFLSLCRPLMHVDVLRDATAVDAWLRDTARSIRDDAEDALLHKTAPEAFSLLVRKGEDATLFNLATPAIVAVVDEPSIVTSFWEYLLHAREVARSRDDIARCLGLMSPGVLGG